MKARLWIGGIAMVFASCNNSPADLPGAGLRTIVPAVLLLASGMATGVLWWRLKKSKPGKKKDGNPDDRALKEARNAARQAEQALLQKEQALAACTSECRELQRKVDELERLIQPVLINPLADESIPGDVAGTMADRYYFLQPTTGGRFTEAGRVPREADALYELRLLPGNPGEAELWFIDTPGNVALAIQNEASWILVACERSNIATASTRSIRTEVPGRVTWKETEWVILQKAKIVYQ